MASSRVFASRLASTMAATSKVARPAARVQLNAVAPKRTFTTQKKINMTPFQTVKRQSPSGLIQANARQAFAAQGRRQYSSEIADAMVQVSQNLGMGSAAIGLGGAGIGIGLVFGSLLLAVSRNPALRGQLFSYAILGFAFVEAIGLFDLMVAMMCKAFALYDLERPTVTTIQSLFNKCTIYIAMGAEAAGWLHQGMASRLAQDIGLNLDSSLLSGLVALPPEEVDLRRRIFWVLYCKDKLAACFGEAALKFHAYNQAVRVGETIHPSGQGGWDQEISEIPADIDAQTDQAFANGDLQLRSAGGKGWS
ncbi:uncharacterized protein BO97DRAFT_445262 [Aspergillus homomorphus CBS 101889]|uniref:ATP synthase subunit 9, mitochondrial n=1 Tax=Aspergillus homomorphus (strain CBS 101889) TaxID=1450537 RepID=A0A395HQ67_ASPHC|nr:hypothetical protein BO97DRAFT_445262 [Aspergillus homomorphus CBS 101889]RAL09756.1 hypothetical protein BO97DRAFT_445262 [Aspergillus homomorphus CBS 101889]